MIEGVARCDRPRLGRVDIDAVRVAQAPLKGVLGVVRGDVLGPDDRVGLRIFDRLIPPSVRRATEALTFEVSLITSGPSG